MFAGLTAKLSKVSSTEKAVFAPPSYMYICTVSFGSLIGCAFCIHECIDSPVWLSRQHLPNVWPNSWINFVLLIKTWCQWQSCLGKTVGRTCTCVCWGNYMYMYIAHLMLHIICELCCFKKQMSLHICTCMCVGGFNGACFVASEVYSEGLC